VVLTVIDPLVAVGQDVADVVVVAATPAPTATFNVSGPDAQPVAKSVTITV
jgi:hypothetical protein